MSKFDFSDIFKQAQSMQQDLARVQEEAAGKTVEGSAGGGMVRVTVNGRLQVVAVQIDPEVMKSGDLAMLQDLVLAASNQAIQAAQTMMAGEMSKVTAGLKIPGLG